MTKTYAITSIGRITKSRKDLVRNASARKVNSVVRKLETDKVRQDIFEEPVKYQRYCHETGELHILSKIDGTGKCVWRAV